MASLAEFLDIPQGLLSSEPVIELFGNKQITVEGCKGILEYSDSLISLSCAKYAVLVSGEGLELRNMSENTCMITGIFSSITFGV